MYAGDFMIYTSPPRKKEVIAFNLCKEAFKKLKKNNKQNPPHIPKGK